MTTATTTQVVVRVVSDGAPQAIVTQQVVRVVSSNDDLIPPAYVQPQLCVMM